MSAETDEQSVERSVANATEDADVARKAGRGGLAITFAKVWFIVLGLVQQIALPRVLGLAGYGALSSALSISSIAYNPVVTTSIQGVSRAIASSREEDQPFVVRRLMGAHGLIAMILGLGFFALSGPIGNATGAPHIIPSLRILAGVMLFYSVYSPLIGVLNGKKLFLRQASLDMLAATLRTIGLIAGGYVLSAAGNGVEGSVSGFVMATVLVLVAAIAWVGLGRPGSGGTSVKSHLVFVAPLLLGQVLLNLLLQADLTLLRTFAAESASAAGLPLTAADPLVGAYRATQLFCFLPYQLLISVTFILFPLLAKAHHDADAKSVQLYVRTGVRLALVLMGLMVSVTSGLSGPLLRLVFPAEAAELGAASMQILTLGFGAFAIFGILVTVLNSLERERASAITTGVAFALVVALCFLRVRGGEFGAGMLLSTALATTAGLCLATVVAAVLVWRSARALVSPISALRVAVALAAAVAVGRQFPAAGKVMTLALAALVGCVYVVVLVATRELGKADVATVTRVLRRKR
ncbi:MAG: lipopolysaccharide biosynthesis protein [Polyangiaceae bacterium]